MFFLWNLAWMIALPIAFLVVGLALLPAPTALLLNSGIMTVAGLVLLAVYPDARVGVALLVIGAVLAVVAFKARAREAKEQSDAAAENADRIRRMMHLHLPSEDDET